MAQLLDYAWARPPVSALAGYVGAARYLSYDDTGKNLTPVEALALSLAGRQIVSNWEWYADLRHDPDWHLLGPYAVGRQHAIEADRQHRACGGPPTAPVYVSADFNVPDYAPGTPDGPAGARAKLGPLSDYFRGWCDVLGVSRVGGYGGYWAIRRLFDAGLITYGWQTRGWSGGLWDGRAHLRQTGTAVVGGAQVDVNEIEHPAFGGWTVTTAVPTGGGGSVATSMDAWKDIVVGAPKPPDMGGPADGIRLGDWVGWSTAKLAAVLAAAEGAQAAANAAAATGSRIEAALKAAPTPAPAPAPAPKPTPAPVPVPGQMSWTTEDGHRLVLTVEG